MDGPAGWAMAIDIGGTKLAVGLVDFSGNVHWSATCPTPADGEAATWQALAGLIAGAQSAAAADKRELVVVGVGCGGPMTRQGASVSPLNIAGWRDFPLRDRVTEATGLTEVHIDNDAKAMALGEGWRGAAQGVRDYLAMVVSTGVGGGLVIDGRLLDGADGNAGHIGHVIVVPGGRRCCCGARGCLEAEVSGTAIQAITGQPAVDAPAEMRERVGRLVGQAVSSVANLLDLRLAIVGGSVALGYGEAFFSAAQSVVDDLARLEFSRGTRVVPAGLGADSPLVGAAAVGWRGLGARIK